MFILFDSNIWISQLGLRSKTGATVRFFAHQKKAIIAIPEIVEMEVQETLTQRLLESRRKIENSHRELLFFFNKLSKPHLPSEDQIREAVARIIPNFDVPSRRIPLNLEASHSSMLKLMRRTPPSKKKEQFRDGAIWAHCLQLLSEGDVHFVTDDKAFYENEDYGKGLAAELVQEMQETSQDNQVFIRRNLSELLEEIKMPLELNKQLVLEEIIKSRKEEIDELLNLHDFRMNDSMDGDINCFATEMPNQAYFTFDLERKCQDFTQEGRKDGVLIIKGSGFIDTESKIVADVKLSNIRLDYPDWQPGGPSRGTVFLSLKPNTPAQLTLRLPLETLVTD